MLKSQIIAQEIDIAIIGSKSYQLISIILNKDLQLSNKNQKNNSIENKYLKSLIGLFGNKDNKQKLSFQTPKTIPKKKQISRLNKFSKTVITDSFWINFHFFIHQENIYDPFVSQVVKGNTNICILACSQNSLEMTQTKNLLTTQSNITSGKSNTKGKYVGNFNLHNSLNNQQGIKQAMNKPGSKMQSVLQGQILDYVHNPIIFGFNSLLTLRINQDNSRIIQDSSNLKLTSNQILRWIVERHFENTFYIKLKENLGDQLENYVEKKPAQQCKII